MVEKAAASLHRHCESRRDRERGGLVTRRTVAALAAAAVVGVLWPFPAHAATPALTLPARPRVLIVGDSYTQGVGDDDASNGLGWAPEAAAALGWQATVDGRGGSGYVNPTTYSAGTFASRLWRHPANGYDLIVIQGSSNDQHYSATVLAGAVNMTLRTVRRRYPSAKVVMVGPTNPYGNTANYATVDAKLKAGAVRYGVPFVDPMVEGWFVAGDGAKYANQADGHPSDAGYKVIATRFVADVKEMQ